MGRVLDLRTLAEHDGLSVTDVVCHHRAGRGSDEPVDVLGDRLRSPRTLRALGGRPRDAAGPDAGLCHDAGPGTALRSPRQRRRRVHDAADDRTSGRRALGRQRAPRHRMAYHGTIDLHHRLLLAAAARGEETDEATVTLAATALEQVDHARVASGRPVTERARRAIADGARMLLAEEPRSSLVQLARALSVSPHHLSRVFSEQTSNTISTHRRRIRVRAVLDRLEHGERDLARLAADVGFADHGHLTRTVRRETGTTPSRLRELLTHPR